MNKLFKIPLVLALLFVGACSDDESNSNPNGDLENAEFSFAGSTSIVEVPDALSNAEDPVALQTFGWVQLANAMTNLVGNFTPPPGATTSSQRIVPANGRVKDGEYLVYIWEESGVSIAYQISQTDDSYIFEILLKGPGADEFFRLIYAEEKKDQSEGFMRVYDETFVDDYILLYEWKREADSILFTVTDNKDEFKFELLVNSDESGSLKTFEGTDLVYEIQWDGAGNGSWKLYAGGEVTSSGEWTV